MIVLKSSKGFRQKKKKNKNSQTITEINYRKKKNLLIKKKKADVCFIDKFLGMLVKLLLFVVNLFKEACFVSPPIRLAFLPVVFVREFESMK